MNVELLSHDWARFAEKIRQNGYVFLQAANPKLVVTDKGAADPNIISATLLCRSLTHLKAVPILLKEGLVVEARTIVRNFRKRILARSDRRTGRARRSFAPNG
jgi:hypothetical protein